MIKEMPSYDALILYWESMIRFHRQALDSAEIFLIEQTIRGLKELKRLSEEFGKVKVNSQN